MVQHSLGRFNGGSRSLLWSRQFTNKGEGETEETFVKTLN